jgi:outer membrane receptor protein involved in Fe transport
MYPSDSLTLNVRRHPAFSAWISYAVTVLLSCTAFSSAHAAEAVVKTTEEVISLQNFVVTGSNIQRTDLEKVVPITVLDQDAMTVRNALLPVDMLTTLPSVVNLPENETRLGSSGARGDNANINLRNLGSTATLILVNGRRMAINPMTAGLSQAVNVNQLPTQGIERIEILRDGASAIYGSDAVAGVINYVLKREFKGAEINVRQGFTEDGGGQSTQVALTFGSSFAGGRGRFFGTVESLYKEAIFLRDRDFSVTSNLASVAPAPFNNLGGAFDARTARGRYPIFRLGTATASNYFRPVNGTPTLTTVAPTQAANPEFYLDLNEFGMASPRMARANSFFSAEYDLTKRITAFADFSYYTADSTMVRQPLALNAPTTDKLATLSIDNPYNPYGSRFYSATGAANTDGSLRLTGAPRTVSLVSVTLPDLGVEKITTTADVIRFASGLRGKLGDTWTWETSGFYNRVNGEDKAYPDVRESLLLKALQRTDASAYNPFGYTFKVQNGAVVADKPYTNPSSVVDSFSAIFARQAESSIASGDLRVTGRLLRWWGGDIMASVGGEYRKDKLADERPPYSGENPAGVGLETTDNDFLLHPPRPDVIGERDITSLYAEFVLPLVGAERRLPLINTLELTASARMENYSDFGETTKPKVGVNWRPLSWLMLRGSYNEGFMAPSLAALFTSPRWSITAGAGDIDTYRNPVTNEGAYVQRGYFGGNPNLKASESEGTTYGVVIDVPGIRGLSVTADHWRIERTNLLGSRSAAQIRASDVSLIQAYTQAQLAAGRSISTIDLGSGTAAYKGDPDIVRYAVTPEDTAAFNTYNAANPSKAQATAGKIFSFNQPWINISGSENEGVDLGLRYVLPKLRLVLPRELPLRAATGQSPRRRDQRPHRQRRLPLARHEQRHLAPQRLDRQPRRVLRRSFPRLRCHHHGGALRIARSPELHRETFHRRPIRLPLRHGFEHLLQRLRRLPFQRHHFLAARHARAPRRDQPHQPSSAARHGRLRLQPRREPKPPRRPRLVLRSYAQLLIAHETPRRLRSPPHRRLARAPCGRDGAGRSRA